MKRSYAALALLVTMALLVQCAPKTKKAVQATPPAGSTTAIAPGAPSYAAADISAGKTLFEEKCANCHRLKMPETRTTAEWERILPDMIRRSHLDEAGAAKVRAYVFSGAKPN